MDLDIDPYIGLKDSLANDNEDRGKNLQIYISGISVTISSSEFRTGNFMFIITIVTLNDFKEPPRIN